MENHAMFLVLVLLIGIPLSVLLRLVAAVFSKNVRNAIVCHPVAHPIRFVIALAALCLLLMPPSYHEKPTKQKPTSGDTHS
jgi:hypothetical protein